MNAETATAAEGEIRSLIDRWVTATKKGDIDALWKCYTADITAFDAISKLQFKGEDYRAHWKTCVEYMKGAEMIFDLHDLTITAGGTTAFSHHLCRCGMIPEDGEEQSGWMRGTQCLVKTADGWRIAHEHFSCPFDPESNKALFDLEP